MADAGQDKTALGIARARFMDGLPRKAKELKGAVALLVGTPDAERPREEMRRRLHALYASAQVFQEETLAGALRDGIQRLDSAREQHRPLSDDDLDMLVELASQLPSLGSGKQGVPSVSLRPRPPATNRGHAPPVPPPPPPRAELPAPTVEPHAPSPRPSSLPRPASVRPQPSSSDVISVMVVDDVDAEAQVRRALPLEQFEVIGTTDPEEALRLARAAAPDVVLVGRDVVTGHGADLVSRLRADPLTDFVPVILLWPTDATHDPSLQGQVGADDSLRKPIEPASLLRRIAALTAAPGRFGDGIDTLHEATVEEVADRVAREIRQGIVDSVQTGRDHTISLGDGTDILAAAWSAVGRIRAHLAQRSGGRVRFRDAPRRGGPAMLALVGEGAGTDEASVEQLKGRRVVVADDDPAVLWFFSGLLKEAGATVVEAADGRAALEQTRRQRPDVVISDILMPEVDGFALCRELKRDVSVADIPVILLSWKEDFLQRMRELQSGASGYLLKEAGGRQILTRILEVLRPRLRLEEQLRAGGEMRGRIDGIGIMSLLESVAAERPDARVTVRDAWNLFELDLRKGNLVTLSRTSTDGSFARGDLALRQLLGAKSGRFTVNDSDAPVRPIFDQPLSRLLMEAARKLSALLDAVSDSRLMSIQRVTFDDPTLAAVVSTSPLPARELLEKLRSGASPRQLIIDGECAPHELESILDDAARRGALVQVFGANDEDLVAEALAERERDLGALLHSNRPPAARRSQAPVPSYDDAPELPSSILRSEPPPGPEISRALREAQRFAAESDADRDLDLAFERGSIPPPIMVTSTPPPVPDDARRKSLSAPAVPAELPTPPSVEADTSDKTPVDADAPAMSEAEPPVEIAIKSDAADAEATKADAVDAALDDMFAAAPPEVAAATDNIAAAPSDEAAQSKADAPASTETENTEQAAGAADGFAATLMTTSEALAAAQPSAEAVAPPAAEAAATSDSPEAQSAEAQSAEAKPAEPLADEAKPVAAKPEAKAADAKAKPVDKPSTSSKPPAQQPSALWQQALFFVAVAAVGFGAFSVLQRQWKNDAPAAAIEPADDEADDTSDAGPAALTKGDIAKQATNTAPAAAPTAPAPTAPPAAPATPPPAVAPERDVGFGRVLPYVDQSRGVSVPDGQGLLVVEANPAVPNARVRIGDRDLGAAPVSSALAAGRHEVIFQRGDESSFRYLVIRGGETRIVQVP